MKSEKNRSRGSNHKISKVFLSIFITAALFFLCAPASHAAVASLIWDANAEPDLTGYKLYYKTGSAGAPYNGTGATEGNSPIDLGNVTAFTLNGLSDGVTYYFAVTAYDSEGFESGYSNVVNTNPSADTTAPLLTSSPSVTSQTDTTATITWSTDETSSSLAQYGTGSRAWGSYPSSKSSASLVTSHSVTLTGLSANTTYYFRVGSIDAAGNGPTTSSEVSFTTDITPDTTAPQISGVQVTPITDTTAVIGWTTDEQSSSLVQYGTTSGAWGSYLSSKSSASLVTSHSVPITGLSANTTYYFRVGSTDAAGNGPTTSNEVSFTTDIGPDTTSPQILSVAATSVTDTTAVIGWTTDERSSSLVQYGTGSRAWGSYPSSKSLASMVTSHSVTITGLNASTTYYFRMGSTDAARNGPTVSSEYSFTTSVPPDTDPPSIQGNPSIDYTNGFVSITFDESNIQNALSESNYVFSPTLLFDSLGGSDDIGLIGSDTYRLYMAFVPKYTIFTLTLSNITDGAGNPLTPSSNIKINDNDGDNMADDWEAAKGLNANNPNDGGDDPDADGLTNLQEFRGGGTLALDPTNPDTDGDGMPDGWELSYGLDPLADDGALDTDNDGVTNYQEYLAGGDPNNSSSTALEIVEAHPPPGSGVTTSLRVSQDASFAVRLGAVDGIDITDPSGVTFEIFDGTNTYSRRGDHETIRMVKLTNDPDSSVKKLWVVYDRARETAFNGYYDFGATVGVTVYAKDVNGVSIRPKSFIFKAETMAQQANARANQPATSTRVGSGVTIVTLNEGDSAGARIYYSENMPVAPYFGPAGEAPALDLPGTARVGSPLNFQPPTIFSSGATVFIPIDGNSDPDELNIYGFNGSAWKLVGDKYGNVQPDGEGWLIPGWNNGLYRDVLNDGVSSGITIWVYHFSSFVAGTGPVPGDPPAIGGTASVTSSSLLGGDSGGGTGCFITSLID